MTDADLKAIMDDLKNRLKDSKLPLRLIEEYRALCDEAEDRRPEVTPVDTDALPSDIFDLLHEYFPGYGQPSS